MHPASSSAAAGRGRNLKCEQRLRPGMRLLRLQPGIVHGGAADQRIRWIADDLVGWFKTRQDFDFLAIVTPNRQRNQLCVAIAHDRCTQTFLSKNQSIGGDRDGLNCCGKGQMDKRIGTWQKPTGAVVDIDLDEEGPGGGGAKSFPERARRREGGPPPRDETALSRANSRPHRRARRCRYFVRSR